VTSAEEVIDDLFPDYKKEERRKEKQKTKISLSGEEKNIIDVLGRKPIFTEELADKTNIELLALIPLLTKLEMAGLVKKDVSGGYVKT